MNYLNYLSDKLYEISGMGSFSMNDVGIALSIFLGVFILEMVVVGWENSSLKRVLKFDRTIRNDFFSSLLAIINLYNLISFIFTLGIFYFLAGLIQKNIHLQLGSYLKNHSVQLIVIFLLGDLKNYIYHYVFHRFTPLWKIHAFHHSASTLSIFTTYREHFIQKAMSLIFDALLFAVLGTPIILIFPLKVGLEAHKLFIHSNIRSDWGFIGKYILVSPAAHRIHHSILPEHYNKNLGSTLIIWDRLFGTYHPGTPVSEVGIPDNQYNKKGYFYDLYLGCKGFLLSGFNRKKQ